MFPMMNATDANNHWPSVAKKSYGVSGLWVGMLVGACFVGAVLLAVWTRRLRSYSSPA